MVGERSCGVTFQSWLSKDPNFTYGPDSECKGLERKPPVLRDNLKNCAVTV
jgi:hypothetical protein